MWAHAPTFTILGPKNITIKGQAGTETAGQFLLLTPLGVTSRFFLLDTNNGSLTIPQGTVINTSVNDTSFRLLQANGNGPFSVNDPLVLLRSGTSAVTVTVTIPQNAPQGNYSFTVAIATFSDRTAQYENYGDGVMVNLDVT